MSLLCLHPIRIADYVRRCASRLYFDLVSPSLVRLSLSCSSSTSTISISIVLYPLPALVWMQFTTSFRLRFTMLPCLSRLLDSPYIVLLIFVHNYSWFDSCVMSYADGGRYSARVVHLSVLLRLVNIANNQAFRVIHCPAETSPTFRHSNNTSRPRYPPARLSVCAQGGTAGGRRIAAGRHRRGC